MGDRIKVRQFFVKNAIRNEIKIAEIDSKIRRGETSKDLLRSRNEHVRQAAFFNKLIDIGIKEDLKR